MQKKTAAFTLIELLVVIAIIAILCALLFPVMRAVNRNRDRTAALSNMRQVGLAVNLYTNEHSYDLPGRVTSQGQDKWPALLATYLQDPRVYAAPGVANYLTANKDPLSNSTNNTSFIMNGFNDKGAYTDESVELRINQFSELSEIILFGMQINTNNFYMDFVEHNENDVLKLDAYNDASVYLFADGSARIITKTDYQALKPGTNVRYGDWLWLADKTYAIPQ